MSAKDLLQKAEALIAEAMGADTTPATPPNSVAPEDPAHTHPASVLASATQAVAPVTQPSLEETNLEAARVARIAAINASAAQE
jgi:hypothetical protein